MSRDAFWTELGKLELDLRLARLWSERAQNEHASVASFDRFALGLLSVAAPPELLEAAHAAALDEIHHARLCFALASAYAGKKLGPGPLDLAGTLGTGFSLAELCEGTVTEGCVGETLAAIEAAACAVQAREPAVRIALEVIAADEQRHAELAWAFVRWAVTSAPELADVARAAFESAASRVSEPKYACVEPEVRGLGFLEPLDARRVRGAALRDGVFAAARELGLLTGSAADRAARWR